MDPATSSDVASRLRRLLHAPQTIESWWTEVRRPILRWMDFQPEIMSVQLRALTEHVTAPGKSDPRETGPLFVKAWKELEANVTALERNYVVYGQNAPRQLHWVQQMHVLLVGLERVAKQRREPADLRSNKLQNWVDERRVQRAKRRALGPLTPRPNSVKGRTQQLSSVDALLNAADAETDFLGRRRKLLESARELLLMAAESVVERDGVQARLEHVATEMAELGRLEAAGVRMDAALCHQLGLAATQRSASKMNTLLAAIEHTTMLAPGSGRVAELTQRALKTLWRNEDRSAHDQVRASLSRSGKEALSPDVSDAIERGYERARDAWEEDKQKIPETSKRLIAHVDEYLNQDPCTDLIHASLYVDGCVDVGGVLSPHRVREEHSVLRAVRYPTQTLELVPAQSVDDLPAALIGDPRSMLADLASQRLLTRRYLGQDHVVRERRVMASEVRVFLLDGSGSMLGPRARMRDAILVAELSTMIARLNQPDRWLTPTLYYRYFNSELGPLHEVRDSEQALGAIQDVLGSVRFGGTDIERALLESFDTVRAAVEHDSRLAHAQVVLITDGEASVDRVRVEAARANIGEVPIGVSIIALGEENTALRNIAASQRENGDRVFYQFVPDNLLNELVKGRDVSLSLHLPESLDGSDIATELDTLVREIELASRKRDDDAVSTLDDEVRALGEVGLSLEDLPETQRTRILALNRDRETLTRRFTRWFPVPRPGTVDSLQLQPSGTDQVSIERVRGILDAIAEVIQLLGGDDHRRQSDAVEMLERLLVSDGLSLNDYERLLRRYPARFSVHLELVRAASADALPQR